MHPVGPQSPSVYWIRRVLVVVVAVALVVGLVWWIAGRKGGADSSADVDQASMTTTTPALTGVLAIPEEDPLDDLDDGDSLDDDSLSDDLAMTTEPETPTDAAGAVVITGESDGESTTGESAGATTDGSDAAQTGEATADDPEASSESKTKKSDEAETSASKTKKAKKTETSEAESTKATKPAKPSAPAKPSKPAKPAKPTTTAPPAPSFDASGRLLCADDAISVKAITLSSSFPVGTQPRLGMAVTNTSSKPCVRDLSGTLQVYTVFTADGDRVWSTNDCFPGEGTDVRQLSPGATANFLIKWAGTTSEPGCTAPRVQVPAGKYVLVAKLGKLKSAKLPFTMR